MPANVSEKNDLGDLVPNCQVLLIVGLQPFHLPWGTCLQFPAVFSNVDSLRQAFLCISGLVAAAEHDQIDIERPKIPAWPEDVRQQTVRDESPRRMPNCPPIAAADSVREGRPSGQLWRRICAISLCTGMLAALCFVCGSLLGSAMGGSRWSPELMDFTNFIGILVLTPSPRH